MFCSKWRHNHQIGDRSLTSCSSSLVNASRIFWFNAGKTALVCSTACFCVRLSVFDRDHVDLPGKHLGKKDDQTSTHLLSQNELGILIVGILASFELSDLDVLLLEFLVVTLFFLDQTVEHRGGDCELGRGGHCEFDLFFSIVGMVFGCLMWIDVSESLRSCVTFALVARRSASSACSISVYRLVQ